MRLQRLPAYGHFSASRQLIRPSSHVEADELLLALPDGAEAIVELGITADHVRSTRSPDDASCISTRMHGRRLAGRCTTGRESASASRSQQERRPIS